MQEKTAKGSTLLQQLGFADVDRGNPRHDLAVAYCKANATRLGAHIRSQDEWFFTPEMRVMRPDPRCPTVPSPFFIGFADGVLAGAGGYAFAEVKITRVPAGDVVRQIEAYRVGVVGSWAPYEHLKHDILVCDYDMSAAECDMLLCRKIHTVRLGVSFETFARAQAQAQIPEF